MREVYRSTKRLQDQVSGRCMYHPISKKGFMSVLLCQNRYLKQEKMRAASSLMKPRFVLWGELGCGHWQVGGRNVNCWVTAILLGGADGSRAGRGGAA